MNLDNLSKRDARLKGLLQQSQQWRRLDAQVKTVLPANLAPHFQTACIEEGGCLVLLAANSMASSRLKMILPTLLPRLKAIHEHIREVRVRVVPHTPPPPKRNTLKLSENALAQFDRSADTLNQKHPELAAALAALAAKHRAKG